MTFLIDHQLPPALARWIADQPGVTGALHVADCGMTEAADTEIWQVCAERAWVLVSKDRDFADLHAQRGAAGPQVLWVRLGNCRRVQLLTAFGRTWPEILKSLQNGEKLVELR